MNTEAMEGRLKLVQPGVGSMCAGSGLLALAAMNALRPVFGALPPVDPYAAEFGFFITLCVGLPVFAVGCIKYAKS